MEHTITLSHYQDDLTIKSGDLVLVIREPHQESDWGQEMVELEISLGAQTLSYQRLPTIPSNKL